MMSDMSERPDTLPSLELSALRALIGGTVKNTVRLPLLSGSMAPTLLPGDVLRVRPADGHHVHTGDIVVFLKNGTVTAHRLVFAVRLLGRTFLMEMGDANLSAAVLQPAAVLGVVESAERQEKRVSLSCGGANWQARRTAARMLRRHIINAFPFGPVRRVFGK